MHVAATRRLAVASPFAAACCHLSCYRARRLLSVAELSHQEHLLPIAHPCVASRASRRAAVVPDRPLGRAPGEFAPGLARRVFFLAVCLLATAFMFDLFDLATRTGALGLPAYWITASGLLLGAAALSLALGGGRWARFWESGRIDLSAFIASWAVLVLFGASWGLRSPDVHIPFASLLLSALGTAVAAVVAAAGRVGEPEAQVPAAGADAADSSDLASCMRSDPDALPPQTGRARAH